MKQFAIADLHLFHKNIIKYDKRPFDSVGHMHSMIQFNWNETVKPDDEVYILGDVNFGMKEETAEFLATLNGKKYRINGNHDFKYTSPEINKQFIWSKDYYQMNWVDPRDGQRYFFVLFHYPIGAWNRQHHGAIHLHGHCHLNYKHTAGKMLDVCVANPLLGWAPISFERVVGMMKNVPIYLSDQHESNEE